METTATNGAPSTTATYGGLHSLGVKTLQLILNRAFALIYLFAILALFYNHTHTLLNSTSLISFTISVSILISDMIFAFMWSTTQAFRMRPITRKECPEKLKNISKDNFPGLDIFICTADPYKEPPLNVVNTALSVMAYDYPTEKVSVYVSDDGGSELTLFAFMEAAKFAVYWLPFCRENKIVERCPEAYFSSNYTENSEPQKIKMMYESMKARIENVVEKGKVDQDYMNNEEDHQAFSKFWAAKFTRHNHPSIIQVLLESGKNKDITSHGMPNLIYLSREKNKSSPHYFKAGALNALLRVSGIMTNAPIILTLDCDMYSNDPSTPQRTLCYFLDQTLWSTLAYVQFPQEFHGLNEGDIYGSEIKGLFHTNPKGMDGLLGPNYVGTGCFFRRRAFFGSPSLLEKPEIPELFPDHIVQKPIEAQQILQQAHYVASCNYEDQSNWGSKMGFSYGSLVEDYYTGYRLQCEGWKSVFCHPERPAFLGDVPISLIDVISQCKRWSVGLLEVAFSNYSPLTFGVQSMGFFMALCYSHYAFWPIWSIPIALYAFIPQIALLNGVTIFPKVTEPWFFLYVFLILGAYGQDCLIFMSAKGTWKRWWNDQRIWMIRGLTASLFGTVEYLTKHLGIATHGFTLTSKVVDDDQGKRYHQGIFEFGVASPMFVTLATAAIINLIAFLKALVDIFKGERLDSLFLQMFLAGFVVINCLPIYEAMVWRADKGRMPTRVTIISTFIAASLYVAFAFLLGNV